MLNLLSFLVGITTILLIARYNKSNKLFWILLMSMMTGFIGGTVVSNVKNVNKINKEALYTGTDNITIYNDTTFVIPKDTNVMVIESNDTVPEIQEDSNVNDDDVVSKPKKPRNNISFFDTS